MLQILIYPEAESLLRTRCDPVAAVTGQTRRLIAQMFATMYAAKGCGLAAPQVGINARLFVYDLGRDTGALINPELLCAEEPEIGEEGCLSIPGRQGYVRRATRIAVRGLDRRGRPVTVAARGELARVFQHEMDHLNGFLFIDRLVPAPTEAEVQSEKTEAWRRQHGGALAVVALAAL